MEFEVTATRKRPGTLSEMVGQDFVVATLSNALSSSKIAPAYLFSGPRGTGKTSTARILAKSLNCEAGPGPEPCGKCSSCREIAKGSSPDVIEIDGASNTSVNDVREIKDEVLYAPQSSPKKIYIIDEVHMLSNSAFNALLKTIEEPPPYIVFVFATTEIHKVPATIRSRCQQFRFRLFSPELIRDKLMEAAGEMNRDFENDALYWIAREAGGSMRDAYTLFDQVLSFSEEKITLSGIREKMGLVGLESTSEILSAASEGNSKRALDLLDEILSSGTAIEQVILELADFLRNLTLVSYGIDKESILGLSLDRFPEGPRKAWNTTRLESAAEDAFTLYRDIRFSLNPRYELELFVGRLCSLDRRLSPEEVLEKIAVFQKELFGGDLSGMTGSITGNSFENGKKKIPESGLNPGDQEAERFFSSFKNNRNSESQETENTATASEDLEFKSEQSQVFERDTEDSPKIEPEEPACAVPVDIGITIPAAEPSPEEKKEILIKEVRRGNLSLASALEKARRWEWSDHTLLLIFDSSYEAAVVKNETDTLRKAGASAGLDSFSVDTRTEAPREEKNKNAESPRVTLIRQVFRGQIVKG